MRTQTFTVPMMAVLAGLLTAQVIGAETVAERFEKTIAKIEKSCASRKLDPGEVCGAVAKLKPADPLATEEGRFAQSLKIPNPVPADSGYKPGMTPKQYFDHLCKTEAGEFIFKTVENVEGILILRPRKRPTDYELEHLYALEDPYGAVDIGVANPQDYLVQPPFGHYAYVEAPLAASSSGEAKQYVRYYRNHSGQSKRDFVFMKGSRSERVPYVVETESLSIPKSRYGYTWRGVSRSHDRQNGIAGGELIVLDLETNEVLGVQRRFIRSGGIRNNLTGVWWLNGQVCPQFGTKELHTTEFIFKVLKPKKDDSAK